MLLLVEVNISLLITITTNPTTNRMIKTRLAPIITNEKREALIWLMRLTILRAKGHTLKLKRTKVFLLKWVVSTVHKRANRALMRFHFVPLLNEYRKRCYKKAWDITWGKRLREGWVAWNNEVYYHYYYYKNCYN